MKAGPGTVVVVCGDGAVLQNDFSMSDARGRVSMATLTGYVFYTVLFVIH